MTYNLDIDSYIGYPITKQYVRSKLSGLKGKPVAVRINSYGGDVQHALDIRQQFIDHGDVTAYIYGMTASAATMLAMGAKKILMSRYALMLIHCSSAWVDTWGQMNAEKIQQAIESLKSDQQDLQTIDGIIVNLYAQRSGKPAKEIYGIMREERWLTAEECLQLGLIDGILEDGEKTVITDALRERLVACCLPVPEPGDGARKRIEDMTEAEAEQEADSIILRIRQMLGWTKPRPAAQQPAAAQAQTEDPQEDDSTNIPPMDKKNLPALAALLPEDRRQGNLTEQDLTTLNDQVSALNSRIQQLENQINDLQAEDGDHSGTAVEDHDDEQPAGSLARAAYSQFKTLL